MRQPPAEAPASRGSTASPAGTSWTPESWGPRPEARGWGIEPQGAPRSAAAEPWGALHLALEGPSLESRSAMPAGGGISGT